MAQETEKEQVKRFLVNKSEIALATTISSSNLILCFVATEKM